MPDNADAAGPFINDTRSGRDAKFWTNRSLWGARRLASRRDISGGDVAAAMERVLEAEREGARRSAESRARAARVLDEARSVAQAIAQRCDERIAKANGLYTERVDRQVAAFDRDAAPSAGGKDVDSRAGIAAAIDSLAERITS